LIVIDASVLTRFLLDDERVVSVVNEEIRDRGHEPLHAPELIEPETLNALRKMTFRRVISARQATRAVADLDKIRLVRYPHEPLRARMWELRDQLSAYDAAYLALVEVLGGKGVLLTADRGLATAARRRLGKEAVTLVAG